MIQFDIAAHWATPSGKQVLIDDKLVATLRAIERHRTLTSSCKALGISYRTLWSLVQHYNELFEQDLITTNKGSGATISDLGHRVLWMFEHGRVRLLKDIQSEADRMNAQWLKGESNVDRLALALSDDPVLPLLLGQAQMSAGLSLNLRWGGSIASLSAFHRGEVQIAGCHLPASEEQQGEMGQMMNRWLRGEDLVAVPVCYRELGWISRPGPRNPDLNDVAEGRVRLVNRNASSSTYHQLMALVTRACLTPESLPGFEAQEESHLAVACAIAAGQGDLGLGVRYAADQYGLKFRLVSRDRYFLVLRSGDLEEPRIKRLLEQLLSDAFKRELDDQPGYEYIKAKPEMLSEFLRQKP